NVARWCEPSGGHAACIHAGLDPLDTKSGVDRQAPERPAVLREDADVVGDVRRLDNRIIEDRNLGRLVVGVALLEVTVPRVLPLPARPPVVLDAHFDVVAAGDV